MDAAAPALVLTADQVERPAFDYVFSFKASDLLVLVQLLPCRGCW